MPSFHFTFFVLPLRPTMLVCAVSSPTPFTNECSTAQVHSMFCPPGNFPHAFTAMRRSKLRSAYSAVVMRLLIFIFFFHNDLLWSVILPYYPETTGTPKFRVRYHSALLPFLKSAGPPCTSHPLYILCGPLRLSSPSSSRPRRSETYA